MNPEKARNLFDEIEAKLAALRLELADEIQDFEDEDDEDSDDEEDEKDDE